MGSLTLTEEPLLSHNANFGVDCDLCSFLNVIDLGFAGAPWGLAQKCFEGFRPAR